MEDRMDKGIKEAMSRQTTPRLASNFTYRTLERIRQEEARREARREKRQFALMLVCVFLILGSCVGVMMGHYEIFLEDVAQALHSFRAVMTEGGFALPVVLCLPLLGIFNYWLRKKFRHLLR